MAIPTYHFVWQQGEDNEINMRYSENGIPVNLSNYAIRMDVRDNTNTVVWTFNSEDVSGGGAVDTVGEADNEATLDANGNIRILVPRTASLNSGGLVASVGTALKYDVFLRNKTAGTQKKILQGTIIIEASQTQWT